MAEDLNARITPVVSIRHTKSFQDLTEDEKNKLSVDLTFWAKGHNLPTHWELEFEHEQPDGNGWVYYLLPGPPQEPDLISPYDLERGVVPVPITLEVEVAQEYRFNVIASGPTQAMRWAAVMIQQDRAGQFLTNASMDSVVIQEGRSDAPVVWSLDDPRWTVEEDTEVTAKVTGNPALVRTVSDPTLSSRYIVGIFHENSPEGWVLCRITSNRERAAQEHARWVAEIAEGPREE